MLQLIFGIVIIFIVVVALYYGVCHVIRIWTGCDFDEATVKLHNFLNGTATISYCIENDESFVSAIWQAVESIVDNSTFTRLQKLSQTAIGTPLLFFGKYNGLSSINISVFLGNESEKQALMHVVSNVVKTYLHTHGLCSVILAEWKTRNDLNMPYLQICYACNKDERKTLMMVSENEKQIIIRQQAAVIDTDDSEDLTNE